MKASRQITQSSASNLAMTFLLLPRIKQDAMSALYAFCREVDDIADEDTISIVERKKRLNEWRQDLRLVYNQNQPRIPVVQELQTVITQYHLPFEYFDQVISGMEMDLEINRYPDFDTLEAYCYRAASVVGLLSIEIFGYQDGACQHYAIHLGKALQLTNILRDVSNDAQRGRIYIPLSELKRYKVAPEEILELRYSERFRDLAASIAERALFHYTQARCVLPVGDRRSMATAELMGCVYWRLLQKIRQCQYDVFSRPKIRLSRLEKFTLISRTGFGLFLGVGFPQYAV